MQKIKVTKKKVAKHVVLQARLSLEKADKIKKIADKHGFIVSDIIRSSLDLFISQYDK